MIEAVVGLLMFVNGEIKEARLQPSMAICLRGKREAERTYSESAGSEPKLPPRPLYTELRIFSQIFFH